MDFYVFGTALTLEQINKLRGKIYISVVKKAQVPEYSGECVTLFNAIWHVLSQIRLQSLVRSIKSKIFRLLN